MEKENSKAIISVIREMGIALGKKIEEMFRNGECDHLTLEKMAEYTAVVLPPPKEITSTEAAKLYRVSLSRFYEFRDAGLISPARKIKGYKTLFYNVDSLEKDFEKIKQMSKTDLDLLIRIGKAKKTRKKKVKHEERGNRIKNN